MTTRGEISAAERKIQRDISGLTQYAENVFKKVWKSRARLYVIIHQEELRKMCLHGQNDAVEISRINDSLATKYSELSVWDNFIARLSMRCGEVDNIINELVEITNTSFEEPEDVDDTSSTASEEKNP